MSSRRRYDKYDKFAIVWKLSKEDAADHEAGPAYLGPLAGIVVAPDDTPIREGLSEKAWDDFKTFVHGDLNAAREFHEERFRDPWLYPRNADFPIKEVRTRQHYAYMSCAKAFRKCKAWIANGPHDSLLRQSCLENIRLAAEKSVFAHAITSPTPNPTLRASYGNAADSHTFEKKGENKHREASANPVKYGSPRAQSEQSSVQEPTKRMSGLDGIFKGQPAARSPLEQSLQTRDTTAGQVSAADPAAHSPPAQSLQTQDTAAGQVAAASPTEKRPQKTESTAVQLTDEQRKEERRRRLRPFFPIPPHPFETQEAHRRLEEYVEVVPKKAWFDPAPRSPPN